MKQNINKLQLYHNRQFSTYTYMSKLTQDKINKIIELTDNGISQRKIAKELWMSRATVRKYQINNWIKKALCEINEQEKKDLNFHRLFMLLLISLVTITVFALFYFINY